MKAKKLLTISLLVAAWITLTYQPLSAFISNLEYINNGIIKLGINTDWGGGIGFFSRMGTDFKNVINRYDTGRNVQQSFYGGLDGSYYGVDEDGNPVPWHYNPVQGGDWLGFGSLIDDKINWGDALYVLTIPKKWSWVNVDTSDVMEQWITLRGDVAQIIYRYTYNDLIDHPAWNQEMPAPYFLYELGNLAFYNGAFFYRTPSQIPNLMTGKDIGELTTGEQWAAYVNAAEPTGWGCGILTPGTNYIQYHRTYSESESSSDVGVNTNYFSPIRVLPLKTNWTIPIQYTAYMYIGNLSDIRNRFVDIRNNGLDLALNGSFESGTILPNNWTKASDSTATGNPGTHTYYTSGGANKYDGTDSVGLTAESDGSTWVLPYWAQIQNGVTGSTSYKISFRYKCDQLYNGVAGVRIIQFDKEGNFLTDSGIISASAVSGNNIEFLEKEFDFTTNYNSFKLEIRLQLNSLDNNASVWFDTIKFSLSNIFSTNETVYTPNTPSGIVAGSHSTNYQYKTGDSFSNWNDSVQYMFDWGDGSDSGWLAVGTDLDWHSWTTTGIYNVRAKARCATDTTVESPWSAILSVVIGGGEAVSAPNTPLGPDTGTIGASYAFSSGGSVSNLGHSLQYNFDWNDGSTSGWLATGTTSASHSWSAAGTYNVRAIARCATHTGVESLWSTTLAVIIYAGEPSGMYNSPAQYKVLPEVIWASATGGGTWISTTQITDVSGGSQVSVYYNTATGRRGPFLLWDNSAGSALRSIKYDNLLEIIDGLDTEAFTYFGTVGAVEFITQDGNHKLQVTARTLIGNYAKTSTAFSLHGDNTAMVNRSMIIPNLANNASYRSSCGFFNPTADSVTVEFTLLAGNGAQIGSQYSRTLAGHELLAFNPFTQAGVSYPTYSFDNTILQVRPTSGLGKVMCFGATANNATNDPAAHIAVQNSVGHDNGPSGLQILPEAIWAAATGGGTWKSEVQIVDATGGSVVSVYFDYGGGNRRGPFTLWTGGAAGTKVKYTNLLETIDGLDSGVFAYYGKVGAVEFMTQDGSHAIQVTARTLNGNYSKTFPGLNLVNAETADSTRMMLIQNYTNNASFRSSCGFFNPTADSVTVEFTLLAGNGAQIGSQFSRTLAGHDFQAFNPFIQAGVPYPGSSHDNVILRIRPTSGAGKVMCFGASVDNFSNDPASHLAVQRE